MKLFTKTALACALAAGSVVASADTVEIRDTQGGLLVTYSADAVTVQGGVITLSNGDYISGSLPGFEPGDVMCGENTEEVNGVCIGTGGGANCGPGTELNQAEDQCVPATPPTLNISSSPSSLADGVTSATLTFQFSRPVTGFSINDINVSPSIHTLSGFTTVDSDTYRVTFNRSGNNSGSASVSVSAGSYQGTNGTSGGSGSRSITLASDGPVVVGCDGGVPDHVTLTTLKALSSFGTATGLMEFDIPRSPGVLSYGFTTTGGSASGQINLGGDSGTSTDIRNMWISDCPGGPALPGRCERPGNLTTMRWSQSSSRTACELDRNKTYYFNVDSESCNRLSGCSGIIQHLGGW